LITAEAEASATDTNSEEFRRQLIEKILMVLTSGSDEECAICLDALKSPVITHCAHLFCRPCIIQVINADKAILPLCSSIFIPPPILKMGSAAHPVDDVSHLSCKWGQPPVL